MSDTSRRIPPDAWDRLSRLGSPAEPAPITTAVDPEDQERKPDEMGGDFEFQSGIKVEDGWYAPDGQLAVWYVVRLPHQCDHWVITDSTDKADAISRMETFIREANAALDKLREAEA